MKNFGKKRLHSVFSVFSNRHYGQEENTVIDEMKEIVEWLCSATLKFPKPTLHRGTPKEIRRIIRKWQVSKSAQQYIDCCVPTRSLDLQWVVLFDPRGIHDFSKDDFVEVCNQGFLPIALDTMEGDPYLMDLRNGAICLFSHEEVFTDCLSDSSAIKNLESVRSMALESYPNGLLFLRKMRQLVEDDFAESCWYYVAGGMELDSSSPIYLSDDVRVEKLRLVLSTPIDARTMHDEHGESLLEVARSRGRAATVPLLEAYWENPDSFRVYVGKG